MKFTSIIFIFSVNILLSLAIVSCGPYAIQKWTGKIYSYQVNDLAFERKQDHEIIPYNDPRSAGMFCMTSKDFLDFLNTYVVSPKLSSPKNP